MNYKIVVFDEVYFYFILILYLNTTGCPLPRRTPIIVSFIYVKIHLSPHTMMVRGRVGVELWLHLFRTLTPDVIQCLASRPSRFTPGQAFSTC
jgi:hypothetical protein